MIGTPAEAGHARPVETTHALIQITGLCEWLGRMRVIATAPSCRQKNGGYRRTAGRGRGKLNPAGGGCPRARDDDGLWWGAIGTSAEPGHARPMEAAHGLA